MNDDEVMAIRKISLYYTLLSALFLMLSAQFTGAILPLLFIIPIIMGSIGVKRRRKSGYLIAMTIIPLAAAIAVLWIRYGISVFTDMNNQISKISTEQGMSVLTTQTMTIGFFLLSVLMLCLAVILFLKMRKTKKLFI